MAEDVREAILARMLVVMKAIPGETDALRNATISDDGSPRKLVLLDGDEQCDSLGDLNRPPLAQRITRMYPIIVVASMAKAKDVGSDLSSRRGKVIKAIEGDADLIALTAKGQGGRYIGIDPNLLAMGLLPLGDSPLKFEFTYLLRPSQF